MVFRGALDEKVVEQLADVLHNHKHHDPSRFMVDENSSGMWLTGWAEPIPRPPTPPPTAEPRTWLARTGWRRYGPIRFEEVLAS